MSDQVGLQQDRRHEGPLLVELRTGQHVGQQPQVGEGVLLEHDPADLVDREIMTGELGGHVEHGRGRVAVLEAPGVGGQPEIKAEGGVARQLPAGVPGQLVDDLGRRGGVGADQVDGAEVGVAHVMVDVDEDGGATGRRLERAEAIRAAAVEGDHDLGAEGELRRRHQRVESGQDPVATGDDEGVGVARHRLHAPLAQDEMQPQHRPQGIAVGVDVTGEGNLLGVVEDFGGPLEVVTHRVAPCACRG